LNKDTNKTRKECDLSGTGRKLHSGPTPRGLPESEDLVSTAWIEPAVSNARSSDFDSHDILYACKRGCEGKVGTNESLFRSVPSKLAIRHTCLATGVEMENDRRGLTPFAGLSARATALSITVRDNHE
jgi:hypothetical protein